MYATWLGAGMVAVEVALRTFHSCFIRATHCLVASLAVSEELKTAGILSLAGILKHSDTMLVLWDATYSER